MKISSISRTLSFIFIAYLVGGVTVYMNWLPWQVVNDAMTNVKEFVKGHDEEKPVTSPIEKVISDVGGVPYRAVRRNVRQYKPPVDAVPFETLNHNVLLKGFHKNPPKGYLLLSGMFDFIGKYNAGFVLISTEGEFIHRWVNGGEMMSAVDVDRQQFVAGKKIRPWCSDFDNLGTDRLYRIHHSVEIASDGTYWSNMRSGFIQYNPDEINGDRTFKVVREITIDDIIKANNEISVLNGRLKLLWDTETNTQSLDIKKVLLPEAYHHNDVQPFVDPRFPTKLGYALLISIRHQNLIAVIDPDTFKILWYQQGITEWQHDVDYYKGHAYVYDNGPFRGYSRLIKFPLDVTKNPATSYGVAIDGRKHGWHQIIRGVHDIVEQEGRTYHVISYEDEGAVTIYNEDEEALFAVQNLLPSQPSGAIQLHGVEFISPDEYKKLEDGCIR